MRPPSELSVKSQLAVREPTPSKAESPVVQGVIRTTPSPSGKTDITSYGKPVSENITVAKEATDVNKESAGKNVPELTEKAENQTNSTSKPGIADKVLSIISNSLTWYCLD